MRKITKCKEVDLKRLKHGTLKVKIHEKAETILQRNIRSLRMTYPELIYPLGRMKLVAVEEKVGISTDGYRILYNAEMVIEHELRITDELLHILIHGLLGHFELDEQYIENKPILWRIMDLSVDTIAHHVFNRTNYFETEYADLVKLFEGFYSKEKGTFPHKFYMECLHEKEIADAIMKKSSWTESDNHFLWQLGREQKKSMDESGKSGNDEDKSGSGTGETKEDGDKLRIISKDALRRRNMKSSESDGHPLLTVSDETQKSLQEEKNTRLSERPDTRQRIHDLWENARAFAFGDRQDERYINMVRGRQHGFSSGNEILTVEEADGKSLDYDEMLDEMTRIRESRGEDPESYDLMLYEYGMDLYGDVPLVEPNEEGNVRTLGTLVIAIDISASCSGEPLSVFLRETRKLLADCVKKYEFEEILVLECDAKLKKEHRIRCPEDISEILPKMKINGFGGTDFRPVFQRVDELEEEGRSVDALIYYTDSYGIYPEKMRENTYFVMDPDCFIEGKPSNLFMPAWIHPVKLNSN